MNPLDLVNLTALMEHTSGRPEIVVGLIDGPVATDHPDLLGANIREIPGALSGKCGQANSIACLHGTFVAGILCAKRGSAAPAICPNCTLLVRPIFMEAAADGELMPSATPQELATAIIECVDAGVRVLNLSAGLMNSSTKSASTLGEALDYAAKRSVMIVAAAGNQGNIGSSAITRHPWVIPVAACDLHGRPMNLSNIGSSIGRRGLSAPGDNITSLASDGKPIASAGTSIAAPFVTGAIALLLSEFPTATMVEVKLAITQAHARQRTTVVPVLLDAWAAYQELAKANLRR